MSETFKTLREVGVALDGFREDVRGQFNTLKWIIGGIAAGGLVIAGVLFSKVDALENTAARNTAILERIEAQLTAMAEDTASIRENVQTASASPTPMAFEGWIGVQGTAVEGLDQIEALFTRDSWIYVPAE